VRVVYAFVCIPEAGRRLFGLGESSILFRDRRMLQQVQHQAAVCIERRTDLTQINELMALLLYIIDPVSDPSDVICGAPHASRGQSVTPPP